MPPYREIDDRPADMDFSVLICTYNRAELLSAALEHIAAQSVPTGLRWEVVVVDNNCSDHTADVVRRFASDPRIPALRYVQEGRQGIAFARMRSFREGRGHLMGCVDDDCRIAPDWIAQALAFGRSHPRAGAFGGRNLILWEKPPPVVAELYGESLGRQDLGDLALCLAPSGRTCLVGAGLVVRRAALLESGWLESRVLVGRCGEELGAGEDAEIYFRIRNAGWECWYLPHLRLGHFIPERRTTPHYLQRLHRGFGEAEAFLLTLSRTPAPTLRDRFSAARWSLAELGRVLVRWPRGWLAYENERPTWEIRIHYACGCLKGALRYLLSVRA
ncbi:hypothetical protein FRZ44_33720 [Hypericibacter terrae]|uniref:Glycosyltransferase 2-like domain-containing protein n=1 Tax=Hypericibacter terrae TaxID=2602015 RepID=A0A5J6MKN1_9PROT|nr:glycosyltransferase [Hypericibacter terrae]QEX18068.1 hypothetical protein FRZ44_33720 [Hypericibacter terrae]